MQDNLIELQSQLEDVLIDNAKQVAAQCVEVCRKRIQEEQKLGIKHAHPASRLNFDCLGWTWRKTCQDKISQKIGTEKQSRNSVGDKKARKSAGGNIGAQLPAEDARLDERNCQTTSAAGVSDDRKQWPTTMAEYDQQEPRSGSRKGSMDTGSRQRSPSVDPEAGNQKSPRMNQGQGRFDQVDTINILTNFMKIRQVIPDGERRGSDFDESLVVKLSSLPVINIEPPPPAQGTPETDLPVDASGSLILPSTTGEASTRATIDSSAVEWRRMSDRSLMKLSPRDVFSYLNTRVQTEWTEHEPEASEADSTEEFARTEQILRKLREPKDRTSISSSDVNEFLGHPSARQRLSVNTRLANSEWFRQDQPVTVGTVDAARVYKERNAELGRCLAELTAELARASILDPVDENPPQTGSFTTATKDAFAHGHEFQEYSPATPIIRG